MSITIYRIWHEFSISILQSTHAVNRIIFSFVAKFIQTHTNHCILFRSYIRLMSVQGKFLNNKKAKTIVNAINKSWNLAFGIPGTGYYADNGTEFKNIKMDE